MYRCFNCGDEKSDNERVSIGWLAYIGFIFILRPFLDLEILRGDEGPLIVCPVDNIAIFIYNFFSEVIHDGKADCRTAGRNP
jgi:hypothetical protein